VPAVYRKFRIVQLVADMEGGKKRVKDFSQTNGNRDL